MDAQKSIHSIPHEVLLRYGGITNDQKKNLYSEKQSLDFVYISSSLRSQISGVEHLYQYGVCQSPKSFNGENYHYFVCPISSDRELGSFKSEQRFCCGAPPQQYCCTSSQFSSRIHIVRSDLLVSPSIFIGASLAFLLFGVFCIIYVYSRLARNLRKASNKLFHETNHGVFASPAFPQPVQNLELSITSDLQPNEPPKKMLLSSSSRLTKISPEKSIHENLSEKTNITTTTANNNNKLSAIFDNSASKSIKNLINHHKLRHSYKMNDDSLKKRKNSTPIKARPVLLKR